MIDLKQAPPQETSDALDARRYRRLQILGCAPAYTEHLEKGNVMRFSNLDAFVDADLKTVPSRGEAKPVSAAGKSLNDEAKDHPRYDNPRDPFASPDRLPPAAKPITGCASVGLCGCHSYWIDSNTMHVTLCAEHAKEAGTGPQPHFPAATTLELAEDIAEQLGENYNRLPDEHFEPTFCKEDFRRAAESILSKFDVRRRS
jgi:hypothetical protein